MIRTIEDQRPEVKTNINVRKLSVIVFCRFISGLIILGLLFFIPAGTTAYWEAWAYMSILFIPGFFATLFFLIQDPRLVILRMKTKEKEEKQKTIMNWFYIFLFITFLIPGFDKRFGWSSVPLWMIIGADIIVLAGYALFVIVLWENRHASRIIEVDQGQEVVTTGMYAIVRHPMYLSISIMYAFSPLALGSYLAMIPSVFMLFVLIARIRNEEELLIRKLHGYKEYTLKVRYRIIPKIW
jgi:protein-S-isoprenylcysteine O-methyltransferase Ste14